MTPRRPRIQSRVVAAFLDSGCWNAGTPFEIASTPVIAVQPAEKAFSKRNRPAFTRGRTSAAQGQEALGLKQRCCFRHVAPTEYHYRFKFHTDSSSKVGEWSSCM